MHPGRAIARRAFADARVRTIAFALLFGVVALVQPTGFRHSFPTVADRLEFARSFGANAAVRLFYGTPRDLLTVGGYTAWRVGGFLSIFAAVWGLLGAVRALRAEEDSGRQELVLAGAVTRRTAFWAPMAAVAAGATLLGLAILLGLLAGHLPAGSSAYLALATISPAPVFAGAGALACQLAPTRRLALELGAALLAAMLLVRVVADTATDLHALRWATPLGWSEELRAFAGARPLVLLLPAAATIALLLAAWALARGRDVGTGLLHSADSAPPRLRLLSSPTALAFRAERGALLGWVAGIGLFALVMGFIADSFSPESIGPSLQRQLAKVGGASLVSPAGALGFYFLFFVLALAVFACSQIAAARHEEADQRLETLLALPVARARWLTGRLALATGAMALLALAAGVLAWAGAASQGDDVAFLDMLGAAGNTLPASLLFLGLAALAFALHPRGAAGIAYGLVAVSFVLELFGSLLGAPSWIVGISPFHHVGLVPAQPFQGTAAVVMVAVACGAAAGGVALFRRRDLVGA